MEVILSPDMERFVMEQVRAGKYDSVSVMIENTLTVLRAGDQLEDTADLQSQIALGIAQIKRGEVAPLDMDAVRAAVHQSRR